MLLFQFVIFVLYSILINNLVPVLCWFQFAKIQFYFQLSTKKMVSRAFDSFDCSTDDCTALIVSSRKPVERLSVPFRFFRLLSPKTTSATAPNQNCAKHHRGSFDSFDCHFITLGALFQPFVIGITPSKRAAYVRLHPLCPWDGTPVE